MQALCKPWWSYILCYMARTWYMVDGRVVVVVDGDGVYYIYVV